MAQKIVGLKELRENIATYIAQIEKGKSFTVVRRSRPIFTISPPDQETGQWEPVIDFTKMKKGGVKIEELLSRL
ncbi:MAG: hypothetical protein Q7S68_04540 [Deltaproteobacteria bacterium]|nr:hypothetical protein [Deltaproteobacteria bacterium]